MEEDYIRECWQKVFMQKKERKQWCTTKEMDKKRGSGRDQPGWRLSPWTSLSQKILGPWLVKTRVFPSLFYSCALLLSYFPQSLFNCGSLKWPNKKCMCFLLRCTCFVTYWWPFFAILKIFFFKYSSEQENVWVHVCIM